ncbi:MAG TPA: helix-turn-helix transcriptional regulator [Chloroflexia bacterium]|nr:helix-turn-helix transcriptional regulator [Chloroflexia bacterium]
MIGPVVRQLRQERNLSQETLANAAHVSSGYLSKLERGLYKSPSFEVLSRIAGALGLQTVELYRAAGIEHPIESSDPKLEPLMETFNPKLADLPKRDRDLIMSEIRRVFREEEEAAT